MRVLIASRRGPSGIRTYTDLLAAGLASLSHEVVVLDETDASTGLAAANVESSSSLRMAPARGQRSRLAPLAGWARRPEVLRRARELEVDVVHATHLDLAPRFERLVVTAWDPLTSPLARYRAGAKRRERPLTEAAYAVVDAVACRRAAAIIAVTQNVARGVRAFGRPVRWIPPFLPDETIRPSGRRSSDVVMVANRIDGPRKGLNLALDAVALARETRPEVRLTLIGSWSDPELPSRLPEFCNVLGALRRTELLDMLGRFGCCIVPSLWEEFGYAGLEALGAGVPLACTPGLGLTGLSGGGVFVAPRRDAASLAQQVLGALEAEQFEFPPECLASRGLEAILRTYRLVLTSARSSMRDEGRDH